MWFVLLTVGAGCGPLMAAAALEAYGLRSVPPGSWDAIVVAGCKVMPDGSPSSALERRVRLAVSLYKEGRAPTLMFTGGVGQHPPAESVASRQLALDLGVPSRDIRVETGSTTTLENARCAADELGRVRILIVSDATHVFRCERVFDRVFLEVRGVGARAPHRAALKQGLREMVALGLYAVAGRL